MKFRIKPLQLIVICSAVILVAASGFGVYLAVYKYRVENPVVRGIADLLSLPVARVGGQTVTYTEYLDHVDAQRTFLKGPTAEQQGMAREMTNDDYSEALERAIRIAAVEDEAKKAGIVVTDLDVDRAYQDLISRAPTSTGIGDIRQFFKDEFNWNEDQFKQYVVRPAVLEDALSQAKYLETQDPLAFDAELAAKISGDEVKRYLHF